MSKVSRWQDEAMIDMLNTDPEFANEYLALAPEESDQPGGQPVLLAMLRNVARLKVWSQWLNGQVFRVRACAECWGP